jgi:hypothetical protein
MAKTIKQPRIPSPIRNGKPDKSGNYKVVDQEARSHRQVVRTVVPEDVAFDVIGIRKDQKAFVLDHIPTGLEIGRFPSNRAAREAILELMQLTDWKWQTPPKAIAADVREIIERLRR